MRKDAQVLLSVADGPEGIVIYTSEEGAIVDCCEGVPALYVEIHCGMNCAAYFGPFSLSKSLVEQLAAWAKLQEEKK